MNKSKMQCKNCRYSLNFSCLNDNQEVVSLHYNYNYPNKLFNVLKNRVVCLVNKHIETNISDCCSRFKKKK